MKKVLMNLKYKIHIYLQHYNEILLQDAVCRKLKSQLMQRANYHKQKAITLKLDI
ncbi:hypothetical protein [Mesobacillus jeotgali]|uniref:hypothetical protein n=1 Tax=Mesobacillus jeotgali TaxID=129985 RepID=UPI001CFE32A0|nr:hypothetical protein [Mesobacillus jeotgali]